MSKSLIRKRKKRSHFTQISNKPLQQKGLSIEATGLLACVMSMPENFEFGREWACWRFDIGREKMARVINELREAGYVKFEQERDENNRLGRAVYIFTDEAGEFDDEQEEPLAGFPTTAAVDGFSADGEPDEKPANGHLYKEENKKTGAQARGASRECLSDEERKTRLHRLALFRDRPVWLPSWGDPPSRQELMDFEREMKKCKKDDRSFPTRRARQSDLRSKRRHTAPAMAGHMGSLQT